MILCKLRLKLTKLGLVLLPNGIDKWILTNEGVKHKFEKVFTSLNDVEKWINDNTSGHPNRLTEEECEEWDKLFDEFINTGEWNER